MFLAGSISHTGTQCMEFVDIFNISLDLSTIYFAQFSGYSYDSIQEGYNSFSGVKLSIRWFCFIYWSGPWSNTEIYRRVRPRIIQSEHSIYGGDLISLKIEYGAK